MHLLAEICDPKTIPWVEEQLRVPEGTGSNRDRSIRELMATEWLPHFGTAEKWLEEPARWSAVLEAWAGIEKRREVRDDLARALFQVASPRTLEHFKRMAADRRISGDELMTALEYLREYGIEPPADRVRDGIASLQAGDRERGRLVDCLEYARSAAGVPWLLGTVAYPDVWQSRGTDGKPLTFWENYGTDRALAAIAFRPDLSTPRQWQQWDRAHGRETREAWARQAGDLVVALGKKKDVEGARKFLQSSAWMDPLMAEQVSRLVGYKELHPLIARWIDRADEGNRHVDGFRGKLERLVEEMKKAGAGGMEVWGRGHRGPGDGEMSWEQSRRFMPM